MTMVQVSTTTVLLAVSVCGLAGCSGGPATGSVAGKVTLEGKPLTPATVVLINEQTGAGASAALDETGTYRIDAVPLGDYQVAIQPPPPPAPHEMSWAAPTPTEIPAKYKTAATSGLSATVKTGENRADFAL